MPLGTQNTCFVISVLASLGAMREPPPGGGWLVLPRLLGGHRLVLLGLPSSPNSKPMRCGGLIGAHTQNGRPLDYRTRTVRHTWRAKVVSSVGEESQQQQQYQPQDQRRQSSPAWLAAEAAASAVLEPISRHELISRFPFKITKMGTE
jgi:hypothetical protein